MNRALLIPLAVAVIACGGADEGETAAGETAEGAADSVATESTRRVVALHDLALRLEPAVGAPAVLAVEAGTPLAFVRDTIVADPTAARWIEAATWDDRRGWAPATTLVEGELWAHYARALGGASPAELRLAYPLEGRWIAEAPLYTTGLTTASTVWLVADSTRLLAVTTIESMPSTCGTEHRIALLSDFDPAGLDEAAIVIAASNRPAVRPVPITPLEEIDPALAGRSDSVAARELGEGWSATGFYALSDDARMVVYHDGARAAAVLLESRGGGEARLVATAESALKPVAAYSTRDGPPTLLAMKALDYGASRVDLYLNDAEGWRRLYTGYHWGCPTT